MGVFVVYLLSAGMGVIPFLGGFFFVVDTEFLHFMSRGGSLIRPVSEINLRERLRFFLFFTFKLQE